MERWPTFLIGGAPRSGTTSLFEYFNEMKTIFMSPIKEPNYFAPSINDSLMLSRPIRKKRDYLNLFKNVDKEKMIGEASPTYLWDPKSPKFIHETIPDVKIIFILRDPVQRSFSHYLNGIGLGYETLPYIDAMKKALHNNNDYSGRIAMASFYSDSIERYNKIFNKNQLKFFIFEEFFKNTFESIQKVLDFLEISEEIPNSVSVTHNEFTVPKGKLVQNIITNKSLRKVVKSLLPRNQEKKLRSLLTTKIPKPRMSSEEIKFGEELYYEDVIKTEKLLSRKLPWFHSV